MVEEHLGKVLLKLKPEFLVKKEISEILNRVKNKVKAKLSEKQLNARVDLNELIIKQLNKLDPADVELNLRRAKLREAKRVKKELEAKLSHISESIENLNTLGDGPKVKINLQDSQVRQEYYEEQKQKAKEVKKKTQEYYQEQKRRKAKIEKHIEILQEEIEAEKRLKEEQKSLKEEEKKKSYENYLKKIQTRAEERKKHMEDTKSFSHAARQEKPLYMKLSEKFWKDVEMPELEKRKEDLKKKRILNSYNSQQIIDHAKWYNITKKDHQKQYEKELKSQSIDRKINSIESNLTSWQKKILDEEKTIKAEKKKDFEELLKKIDRKVKYASLVKEMYQPAIDSVKQKECEMRKAKYSSSVKLKGKDPSENSQEKNDWKPHKFKPNPMIPKKSEKKTGEIVDYLRKIREEKGQKSEENNNEEGESAKINLEDFEGLTDEEKVRSLKKKSKMIEKEIRKKEVKSSRTPLNFKESDDINEMLISSIKAKIAILERAKDR